MQTKESFGERLVRNWKLPAIALIAGTIVYLVFSDSYSYRRPRRDAAEDGHDRGGQQIRQKTAATTPRPAPPRRPDDPAPASGTNGGTTATSPVPTGEPTGPGGPAVTMTAGHARILVHLLDAEDGTPVTTASVFGWVDDFGGRSAATADAETKAQILSPCPAGAWSILVQTPEGVEITRQVEVKAADRDLETTIRVPHPGVGSIGVRFHAPTPVRAVVASRAEPAWRWVSSEKSTDYSRIANLPSGRYSLALLGGGENAAEPPTYQYFHNEEITVGGGLAQVEVAEPSGVPVQLAPSLDSVASPLTAAFSGWARLVAKGAAGNHAWWLKLPDGGLVFENVPAGTAALSLLLLPEAEPVLSVPIDVPATGAGVAPLPAGLGALRIEARELGTEQPPPAVAISLRNARGARLWSAGLRRGEPLEVGGLPAGTYRVDAECPGFRLASETIPVPEGGVVEVRLGLSRQ